MGYLDRTLTVKGALSQAPDLLNAVREVFESHFSYGQNWLRRGTGRCIYEIGLIDVPDGRLDQLLLKLPLVNIDSDKYRLDARPRHIKELAQEIGAFDAYFDLLSGAVTSLGTYYSQKIGIRELSTTAEVGDLGAVPYFHLIVVWDGRIGFLTEGTGGPIPPKGTVECTPNGMEQWDQATVTKGRIVDLEPQHSDIGKINERQSECLRLAERGAPYFLPENRLDLS